MEHVPTEHACFPSGATRSDSRDAVAHEPRDADELVGTIIGGNVVERMLAEGGMGVVYAARAVDGARVALKVLRPSLGRDEGMIARFEREVALARRIDHPNVVRLLADGRLDDGRPWYAMEHYRGATLGALVRAAGPLALPFVLAVLDGVLAGLEALHEAGVVHRDLQPDNVFLAEVDGRLTVKLLDLGLAQEAGVDRGDGVTQDSPGALVGTLRFVAPEQALRARAITPQSDLFVAALLAHYALTAKLPFRGDTDADVLVSLVRAAPMPLRRERRDLPRAVEEVLARALAKHPEARFASARAMRDALAAILPEEPRARAA